MAVKMDTHIHTSFSTDSETDMQEQILTSYKKGLEGICITDHMDYNFPESALEHPVDGIPFCFDLDDYFKRIHTLQKTAPLSVYTGVECEDGVFLGPSCVFTNVINPRAFIERKSEYRRTVVKKGASIGANATIVCGHDIGRYAFVGAGSVVTKNVPDYAMVYGSPAKVQGYVCQCGEKLHFAEGKACCTACGKQYHMNDKSAVEELEKI